MNTAVANLMTDTSKKSFYCIFPRTDALWFANRNCKINQRVHNPDVNMPGLPDCWYDERLDVRENRPHDRVSTWPSRNPIIWISSWSLKPEPQGTVAWWFSEIAISAANNFGTSPIWPLKLVQCFRMPEGVLHTCVQSGKGHAYIFVVNKSIKLWDLTSFCANLSPNRSFST